MRRTIAMFGVLFVVGIAALLILQPANPVNPLEISASIRIENETEGLLTYRIVNRGQEEVRVERAHLKASLVDAETHKELAVGRFTSPTGSTFTSFPEEDLTLLPGQSSGGELRIVYDTLEAPREYYLETVIRFEYLTASSFHRVILELPCEGTGGKFDGHRCDKMSYDRRPRA